MAIDLNRLEESPHLTDLLIQMENVLDSLDIYVFDGWLNGELISGPDIRRYWLDCTLRYENKPDERGALRLIKHGVQVKFKQMTEGERTSPATSLDEREETSTVWTVSLRIPRRLVTDMNEDQIDYYDDEGEVDAEDVQDANDAGMNDETGYVDDNPQADGETAADNGAPPPEGANGKN